MPGYLEFRVSLRDIKPGIWRRFLLKETASFEALHEAIQASFGWGSEHLFEFRDKGGRQALARDDIEDQFAQEDVPAAKKVKLSSFFTRRGTKCQYVYDFGDDWRHDVEFLGASELPDQFKRRLLDGARACPPEDCGGPWGYQDCVKVAAMSEPEVQKNGDADLAERKEWVGDWDPEVFDLQMVKKMFDA